MFLLLYGTSGFVQTFLIAFWITNWTSSAEKTSSVKSRAILAAAFLQRVRRERQPRGVLGGGLRRPVRS